MAAATRELVRQRAGNHCEYCGLHHADMLFRVRVMKPAAFDAWARARQRAGG